MGRVTYQGAHGVRGKGPGGTRAFQEGFEEVKYTKESPRSGKQGENANLQKIKKGRVFRNQIMLSGGNQPSCLQPSYCSF